MKEKSAFDYAAEMFNYVVECECGQSQRVNARRVRPNLRVVCRKCQGATFIDETAAIKFNSEFNESMRQVAQQLGVPFEPFGMPKQRADAALKARQPKGYPVGLVGESFYQDAVAGCRIGDRIKLLVETGNPHDPKAIVAVDQKGQTLGYVPRDSFVHRLVYEEKGDCSASVLRVNQADSGAGQKGIVIDVIIDGKQLGVRPYQTR